MNMVKKKIEVIQVIIAILGLIILSFQGWILLKQTAISEGQAIILQRTTQSNKADLILVKTSPDIRRYSFRIDELDEPYRESEKFNVGIMNLGKTIVPLATVRFITSERFLAEKTKDNPNEINYLWYIEKLKSLNDTSKYFELKLNPRGGDLTPGEYNLTFGISCSYCEQPYKEENITICIYSDYRNAFDECGQKEEWRLN